MCLLSLLEWEVKDGFDVVDYYGRVCCHVYNLTGVGEYVIPVPVPSVNATGIQPEQLSPFTVTPNCVLVNIASPQAVAEAVLALVLDEGLRMRLSAAGRISIERVFTLHRQMQLYGDLYRML